MTHLCITLRPLRHALATLALLTAACAAVGCTPTHSGRILVTVSTDLAVPSELARVEVATPLAMHSFDPPLPFSLAVAATSDREANAEVLITVRGFSPDGTVVVTRTARTRFIPNRTLVLPIVLARTCSTVGCAAPLSCDGGSVCTETGCRLELVEPTDLDEARAPGDEIASSTDAGLPTGLEPVPVDGFCGALAAVQCEAVLHCCPGVEWDDAQRTAFRDGCTASVVEDCETRLLPVVGDPRVGYDPVRAATVFARGRRLTDPLACSLEFVDWYASNEEGVLSLLQGTVLVGQDCSPMHETDVAALYSCRSSACQFVGGGVFRCAPRACPGEQCVGELACAGGLYCTSTFIGSIGRCSPRLPPREPCTSDAECESYVCDPEGSVPRLCRGRSAVDLFCPPELMAMM